MGDEWTPPRCHKCDEQSDELDDGVCPSCVELAFDRANEMPEQLNELLRHCFPMLMKRPDDV